MSQNNEQIRKQVEESYAERITTKQSCCGSTRLPRVSSRWERSADLSVRTMIPSHLNMYLRLADPFGKRP